MARPMGALGVVPTALLRLLITALLKEVGDPRYDRPHDLAPDYDFIIVGGGSAGSVMAARLAEEAGWRVLLLEAGAKQPVESRVPALNFLLFQGDADWNYRSQPQQHALKAYKDNVRKWDFISQIHFF
nr:glucose dehydrogenase [FAD, quinone]-like [Cherax quadricarinatus]